MKKRKHTLTEVWEKYPDILKNEHHVSTAPSIEKFIAEVFAIGQFYYYLLNVTDSTISNVHENILEMHGLKQYPQYLQEIIDLVHPEDIPFVLEAERMTIEKMKEIGFEHQMSLKSSYCFRMKTDDGSYQMFHHQALHVKKDEEGRLIQAVNIHTNIQHITPVNNYIALVSGINDRNDFHQMRIKPSINDHSYPENLTKRELEILLFIAKGNSCTQIAEHLFLSEHTIRTHRKNIIRKTQAKNSAELVKKCIEWGYL